MSRHLATVKGNNCLLTGRNLGAEPESMVGGHLSSPVGLSDGERERDPRLDYIALTDISHRH